MSIMSCGLGRDVQRKLYSPKEAEKILGISHAFLYRLIGDRRLDARKIDGKTVITAVSIEALIESLPVAQVIDQGVIADAQVAR